MQETSPEIIDSLLQGHNQFFHLQETKSIPYRKQQLLKLKDAIVAFQPLVEEAMWKDLHKSAEETYYTEIMHLLKEVDFHISNLESWARPQRVPTPFYLFPSKSRIHTEPLGTILILAPWNYPFLLLINPLIGAISAGCCAMIKPSPSTPHVAIVVEEMIKSIFDEEYISIIQGGKETNKLLFEQKFDLIFFTGSSKVGKIVMKAAAEHLTPVILELGGKSPCIVDEGADLEISAKRIAFGKTLNAGQTCIAPDYMFVHESVKEILLEKIKKEFHAMFGENIQESEYYGRIVNQESWIRLKSYLGEANIYSGGAADSENKYIEPTLLELESVNSPIMKEEIFGPILPVISFSGLDEVLEYIQSKPKPLALYYFGDENKAEEILEYSQSGGACINDTMIHVSNLHLPFGGVGNSGMGKYHGKESFLAFSHKRSVVTSPTWFDLPAKYPPFPFFPWLKKII